MTNKRKDQLLKLRFNIKDYTLWFFAIHISLKMEGYNLSNTYLFLNARCKQGYIYINSKIVLC
jgi:hypothetical protein